MRSARTAALVEAHRRALEHARGLVDDTQALVDEAHALVAARRETQEERRGRRGEGEPPRVRDAER